MEFFWKLYILLCKLTDISSSSSAKIMKTKTKIKKTNKTNTKLLIMKSTYNKNKNIIKYLNSL